MTNDLLLFGYTPHLNPAYSIQAPLVPDYTSVFDFPSANNGANNFQLFDPLNTALTGARFETFIEDYYYRIHILDPTYEVGALTQAQQRTFYIWNSYFQSKTLAAISEQDADGITIAPTSYPLNFKTFELKPYTLDVTFDGPAIINAVYTFDFTSANDVTLTITGLRIVAWPYIPNGALQETLEWGTDVLTANDGTEQRRRLKRAPRQSFDMDFILTESEFRKAQNLLFGWQQRNFGLPVWFEAQKIANVVSGQLVLSIDTTESDYRTDGLLIVWASSSSYEIATVDSLTSSSITLKQGLVSGYTMPYVMPVRVSDTPEKIDINVSKDVFNIQSAFRSVYNVELTSSPSSTYNSVETFTDLPLLSSGFVQNDSTIDLDSIDYGNAFKTYSDWLRPKTTRQFVFFIPKASLWAFREFLHRRAGRLKSFWMPSYTKDLILVSTGVLTDTIDFTDENYSFSEARQHVGFYSNNTWVYRQINTVAYPSTGVVRLTLDSSVSLNANVIERVSFVERCRFNTDRIELVHTTDGYIECTVPIIRVDN